MMWSIRSLLVFALFPYTTLFRSSVAVLLDELGSEVDALTVAVLEIVPPSLGALTVIVIVEGVLPVGARLARVHVTLALVPLHVQPAPLALWKVTPAGSVSVTVTLLAVGSAAVRTLVMEVSVLPACTGSGESLLVIERSAEAVTVVGSVAGLLDELGSEVDALTVAVLEIVPPSLGALTVIVIVEGVLPVGARHARLHSFPTRRSPDLQPAPLALWKVTPAGSVSVTVTLL